MSWNARDERIGSIEMTVLAKSPGIQFLRALAVISVIVFHLDKDLLSGGFVGVDIFFAISGFVIAQSLIRHWSPRLFSFLATFYSRRVFRIAPALFVFLATTSLLVALFVPRGFFLGGDGPRTAVSAVFGVSNFSLYFSDRGYFDQRIDFNAFSHTWSLGVEEQFYLIFPLLMWLSLTIGRPSSQTASKLLSMGILALPVVGSFTAAIIQSSTNSTAAFYLLPSRFWELGTGALLAMLIYYFPVSLNQLSSRLAVFTGAAGTSFALLFSSQDAFPFPWAIPAVVGTLLLILAFEAGDSSAISGLRRAVAWKPIQLVGDWSYSLYLWHWGVFVLLRWTVGLSSPWQLFSAVILTLGLGTASYYYIERPVLQRRLAHSWSIRRTASLGLVATILLAGGLHAGDRATNRFVSLSSVARDSPFSPPPSTPDPEEYFAEISGVAKGKQIFVVGDSHAGHWGTLLTELRAVMGFEYSVIDDRFCPVMPLVTGRDGCDSYEEVMEIIARDAAPGDVVVFSSLRVPRISSIVFGQERPVREVIDLRDRSLFPQDLRAGLEDAREVVDWAESLGLNTVVTSASPVFPSPPFRCLDWFNSLNSVCGGGFEISRQDFESLAGPVERGLTQLESEKSVLVWDIGDTLCPGDTCSAQVGEKFAFYDGDHLSEWGNYLLMPDFVKILAQVWGFEPGQLAGFPHQSGS